MVTYQLNHIFPHLLSNDNYVQAMVVLIYNHIL
nr:MAG TPA: hypothetical protein [Caudoviricetes sp.]